MRSYKHYWSHTVQPALEGISNDDLSALQSIPGVVATVVTGPIVMPQYAQALSDLRDYNSRANFTKIEYRNFYGQFVETGRDSVAHHAINSNYQWMLQVDADAAPFRPDALLRFLRIAFLSHPEIDMLGAYCQQKGGPNLPTIDTGTGQWEPHYPGGGLIEVIRTGCHFFLLKTRALQRFGPPWFRSRMPPTDLEVLGEFDGLCRRNFDGRNPFTSEPQYEQLLTIAREAEANRLTEGSPPDIVGEDSSFCDRLRASGGKIFVDTDLVVGHIDTKVIGPSDLKRNMEEKELRKKLTVGVLK